jgi:threonine/homoserine/homoserine lactone efflux protein
LQIFILGITFLVLQFSSGCFYAFLGGRIKRIIDKPGYQQLINRLSALVLLAVTAFLIAKLF